MTAGSNRKYEALYTELLGRGEMLHQSNKRRIRRGVFILVILPAVLEFIRWMTDSDKVVFLIIWIIIMFVLSAYLISIEYLDYMVEKTLKDVTDIETDFGELLPRPELRRGDLHDRIRARFMEMRTARLAIEEEKVEQLREVQEAEKAMEELQETVPAEIITAMKEAFDADMHRKEIEEETADAGDAGEEDEA